MLAGCNWVTATTVDAIPSEQAPAEPNQAGARALPAGWVGQPRRSRSGVHEHRERRRCAIGVEAAIADQVAEQRRTLVAGPDSGQFRRTECAVGASGEDRQGREGVPDDVSEAIAAEHMSTAEATETDWPSIAALYLRLEQLTGSPIVRLNRAVAVAEAEVATAGLAILEDCASLLADHHLLPADCQPVRGRRIQLRR